MSAQPYVNESHKPTCALRFMTGSHAAILRAKCKVRATYGHGEVETNALRCRCKPNPHIVRVRAFAAVIEDQRARGMDPWSDEGWAERAKGYKRVKAQPTKVAPVQASPSLLVKDAALALRKAEAEVARIRAQYVSTLRSAVASGERPARLARLVGLSRQRVNQLLTERKVS